MRLTWQDAEKCTQDLCRQIAQSHWQPDYIVGLTRGGLLPAVMLSQYLDVPMHALKVSLRDGNSDDSESNLWMAEDAYKGKNILIVDDINDTGATFNWIMQDWPSGIYDKKGWNQTWNHSVKFAVLVDNLASKCDVKMDYAGLFVNKAEDPVWVDFPWEVWWR